MDSNQVAMTCAAHFHLHLHLTSNLTSTFAYTTCGIRHPPIMESAVVTLRDTASAITSRPVQRALINLTLLTLGALSLLATAAIASALFFQNFVPHQVTSLPVYLQYGCVPSALPCLVPLCVTR